METNFPMLAKILEYMPLIIIIGILTPAIVFYYRARTGRSILDGDDAEPDIDDPNDEMEAEISLIKKKLGIS